MTNPPLFRVGLLLTERCDVACRHCWFSSSPDGNASMTLEQAKRYVDEAAVNGARWVSFTGGEPFLVYGLLRGLTAYASSRELFNEAVTNCNWATSRKTALDLLSPLRDAGLDTLNLSVDDFHQECIPLERVRNCYEAAKWLELKPVLMIAVKKDSVITADRIGEIMEDPSIQVLGGERVPKPSAIVMETHFAPVGRGEKIPKHELRHIHVESEPCRQLLTDIGVRPNGDVMPCCGPLGAQDDAVIGNLDEESLREVLERAWLNPRLREIYETGFRQIDGSYVSRCHMCVEAYQKN